VSFRAGLTAGKHVSCCASSTGLPSNCPRALADVAALRCPVRASPHPLLNGGGSAGAPSPSIKLRNARVRRRRC
jgi:hypothetical protein